ncbi:MAG: FAD-dependent oxidoreductase, partial [Actinomycetota bacterium]|nr:FAD-dependent oxidoreductase [Actinomycetota bacterium]
MSSEPRYAPWEKPNFEDFEHRVLILGGGFAGYNAARHLCELTWDREDVGVMLIDRQNYLTFWPMVAGIVSSGVGTRNIAHPLRRTLIRVGASVRRAEVENVDLERQVVTADGKEFPYDQLVLALGAQPSYFGIPGVEEHALPMKGIPDAVNIRNRVI